MKLPDLIAKLETTPVVDVWREVKIVVMGEDGETLVSLGIAKIGEVHEWTDTPNGRQLQHKLAIVTEPMRSINTAD